MTSECWGCELLQEEQTCLALMAVELGLGKEVTSGCFGRDKREDGGEGHWRLARNEGVRDKWMMWQQLNYFESKF